MKLSFHKVNRKFMYQWQSYKFPPCPCGKTKGYGWGINFGKWGFSFKKSVEPEHWKHFMEAIIDGKLKNV